MRRRVVWALILLAAAIVAGVAFKAARARAAAADDCSVLQTIDHGDYRIQIVADDCKEGLPHTTDAHTVRMIADVWSSAQRDSILRHERIHLAQKRDVQVWYAFYARHWNYTCSATPPPELPANLRVRLRPNPDTADAPWAVWRDRWLFFPAFTAARTLRGAEVIVFDLQDRAVCDPPPEWRAAFCDDATGRCPHQYEHPHEIAAEWATHPSRAAAARPLSDFLSHTVE
jgi:hypothetical protein